MLVVVVVVCSYSCCLLVCLLLLLLLFVWCVGSLLVSHLKCLSHCDVSHNELVLFQLAGKLVKGEFDARAGVIAGSILMENAHVFGMYMCLFSSMCLCLFCGLGISVFVFCLCCVV